MRKIRKTKSTHDREGRVFSLSLKGLMDPAKSDGLLFLVQDDPFILFHHFFRMRTQRNIRYVDCRFNHFYIRFLPGLVINAHVPSTTCLCFITISNTMIKRAINKQSTSETNFLYTVRPKCLRAVWPFFLHHYNTYLLFPM